MTEYDIPTTNQIRSAVAVAGQVIGRQEFVEVQFDRWLAAHDAEVARNAAANALREMAGRVRGQWTPDSCPWVGALDDEADRIERQGGDSDAR